MPTTFFNILRISEMCLKKKKKKSYKVPRIKKSLKKKNPVHSKIHFQISSELYFKVSYIDLCMAGSNFSCNTK